MRVLADVLDGRQKFRRSRAAFQTALGGELIHQTVGERIAEGHAEFQDVHARPVEREREVMRGLQMRIARADVSDEAFFAGGFQL